MTTRKDGDQKEEYLVEKFNLQLFAEGGEGADGAVNTSASTGNNLSAENKTFYDRELIKMAGPNLVYSQFAQKRNIPKNGEKTIKFRGLKPLAKATTSLTEGVTPDGQTLNIASATVGRYGGFVRITDFLDLTAIDPVMIETVDMIGDRAGRTVDTLVRDVVMTGTNVQYADGSVSSRAALTGGAATGNNYLTVDVIKKAVRALRKQNAKPIDGYFAAIVHPDTAYDLMSDPEWKEMNKYTSGNVEKLYKGEIGCVAGVRFVESTEAKIWKGTTDGGKDGRAVYGTIVLGANAYGTTEIEGNNLRTVIKQLGSAGTADPLDQRSTIGWKATLTTKILVDEYMVRGETCSSFNSDAN